MIASLAMYWRPETAPAWQGFWRKVQAQIDLPDLTPPEDLPEDWCDHWRAAELALSMTCGLPLRTVLRDRVTYVGTLDFGLGGPAGSYHSVMITRPGCALDRKGLRLAYNAPDSQSGWAVTAQGPNLREPRYIQTGSHLASFHAVAEGSADLAFVDAVTWRLIRRHEPRAGRVLVVAKTPPTPGLPFITALGRDPAPLRDAIRDALAETPADVLVQMGGVTGLTLLDMADYTALPAPPPAP